MNLYLEYEEVYNMRNERRVLRDELPTEATYSLPMPTKRWQQEMFASFCSIVNWKPDPPIWQSVPMQWWLVGARGGRLWLFTQYQFYPFAPDIQWEPVELQLLPFSDEELDGLQKKIFATMDQVAPTFFSGEPGDPVVRHTLLDQLQQYINNPQILRQYRALTPDFFAWLEQ